MAEGVPDADGSQALQGPEDEATEAPEAAPVTFDSYEAAVEAELKGAVVYSARLDGKMVWWRYDGTPPDVAAFRIREGRAPSEGERFLGGVLSTPRPRATLARLLSEAAAQ